MVKTHGGEPGRSTEGAILDAAKKVFLKKGLDGARMQEIADEAGINKALLHYYFRTKDKLFEAVFHELFLNFFPGVMGLMKDPGKDLFRKIELFVEQYMDMLIANPYLPGFIMHEISKTPENPAFLMEAFRKAGVHPDFFIVQVNDSIKKGVIRPIDPIHLLIHIIALCVFPFIARPIISQMFFDNPSDYDAFIEERKKEIPKFIIQSIKKK
jgi:TetR/AcrR family transcriptional regulator